MRDPHIIRSMYILPFLHHLDTNNIGCMIDTSTLLINEARDYIGVRFRHQGRSKIHGVDCLGLLICVAQTLDLTSKKGTMLHQCDYRTYSKIPDKTVLYRALSEHLEEKPRQKMTKGDIALMEFDNNPQHLAIISDYPADNYLGCIHAYAPAKKVVEHHLDSHWKRKITHLFKLGKCKD